MVYVYLLICVDIVTVLHFGGIKVAVLNLKLDWSVANWEFEICHVRQHSNMLIISPKCRIGGVLPFAFALGEYSSGALREYRSVFFPIGEVLLFVLSHRVQSRRADVIDWAMGFCVKTMIFPNYIRRFFMEIYAELEIETISY